MKEDEETVVEKHDGEDKAFQKTRVKCAKYVFPKWSWRVTISN